MRWSALVPVVLVVALAAPMAHAADGVPVVVALDTSRSLSLSELGQAAGLLRPVLAALPEGTAVGVMEFNDAPHWLLAFPGSPSQASEAMGRAKPGGNHTTLLDALVTAARELPAGGVIIAVTDGRDEDSAATVSDLAVLLAGRQVRIVAVGAGHQVDARTLRRLAVLSGGQYVGRLGETTSATVQGAVERARQAVLRSSPPPPTPVPVATVEPVAVPTAARPVRAAGGPDWLVISLGAVAVVALIIGILAWRQRAAAAERMCPDCNRPMASWETECSACKLDRLDLQRAERETPAAPPAKPLADEELPLDPSVFDKAALEERLEKTLALSEQVILVVRTPRGPQRSFALDPNRVVAVGRAPKVNSITLDDLSVSAQHFKLVPKDDDFYVVDLDSSNGTFVNGERVRVHKLHNGDTIVVGQVECQFRTQLVRTA